MKRILISAFAGAILSGVMAAGSASAQNVLVTPLGSHAGEFCSRDRAMIFEDPDGTRLLYDPGMTVAGPDDPRLGKIDAVLISHMHGDHVGHVRMPAENAGTCAKPDLSVRALPNTNAVDIAIKKDALIVTGSEMPRFFAGKLKVAGGDPKKSRLVRFGANRRVGKVNVTTVPAAHSNGISGSMVGGDLGKQLNAAGLTAYAGPPTGYVLEFSNGLVVYLSGDTGMTAEQETVIGDHYKAELAVINIGDVYTTGPEEAAYVINEMVKAKAVIPSHANQASTENGRVVAKTRTAAFMAAVKVPAHLPLSGRTMAFDGYGVCQSGC